MDTVFNERPASEEQAKAPTRTWSNYEPFGRLVLDRSADDAAGLKFRDQVWTWREIIVEAVRRADFAERMRLPGPWHIGLLLGNTPEHLFWILAAGLSGATVVGINPNHRGTELARDIEATDVQMVITDSAQKSSLAAVAPGLPGERIIDAGSAHYAATPAGPLCDPPSTDAIFSLVFTSGTTATPKAVICTQGRLGAIARQQQERRNLTSDDVFYVVMPLFHSNALMAGIAPAVSSGGCIVLREKFSASNWLADVRKYGVTYFNYVGKPLSYILATQELPDDADNPLKIAFGNEANETDIEVFSKRFGCDVVDSYGTSEGGMRINRVAGAPGGSLGLADENTIVMNPDTLRECAPAEFDEDGQLLNPDEAIGEIVNTANAPLFEGYYRNAEASRDRVRHGYLWSGDLAYRDAEGYWYFAGRTSDRLRVDGENFSAAPVERVISRFDSFRQVAVYAVPDPAVGDRVMAAVEIDHGKEFDGAEFGRFIKQEKDLGRKWAPTFVRVSPELPRTPTNKILKRTLRTEGTHVDDQIFVHDEAQGVYTILPREHR